MLIDEINSVPAFDISPENEKIQSLTNGLEVLSTILAHKDLKLPNTVQSREKLEETVCFLVELLPENMYSGVSYRSFKKELKLIENGTRAIKTFFCWRFAQLTHPLKDLPPGISHTPEKVNPLLAYPAKINLVLQNFHRRRNRNHAQEICENRRQEKLYQNKIESCSGTTRSLAQKGIFYIKNFEPCTLKLK